MVDKSNQEREGIMKEKKGLMEHPCTECGDTLEKKLISREFEREGITIKLSGIKAWVCRGCGEIYFQPGGVPDKVADAVNSLFSLVVIEKQHKRQLTAQVSQA